MDELLESLAIDCARRGVASTLDQLMRLKAHFPRCFQDVYQVVVMEVCTHGHDLLLEEILREHGTDLLFEHEKFYPSLFEEVYPMARLYPRIKRRLLELLKPRLRPREYCLEAENVLRSACNSGDVETVRQILEMPHGFGLLDVALTAAVQDNRIEVLEVILSTVDGKSEAVKEEVIKATCLSFGEASLATSQCLHEWCTRNGCPSFLDKCVEIVAGNLHYLARNNDADMSEDLEKLDFLFQEHLKKNMLMEHLYRQCILIAHDSVYAMMLNYGYPVERLHPNLIKTIETARRTRQEVTEKALLDLIPELPADLIEQEILTLVEW